MNFYHMLTTSSALAKSNGFLWALAAIVIFIQFLPYVAILLTKKVGAKLLWLLVFIIVTGLSWVCVFWSGWIDSDFLATALLLFPNYFLYAIAMSTSRISESVVLNENSEVDESV